LWEEGADAVFGVDHDDRQRQIRRQGEQSAGVDAGGGTVAFDTAQDGGAGQACPVGAVDDLGVGGPVVPVVALPDEDRQAQRRAVQLNRTHLRERTGVGVVPGGRPSGAPNRVVRVERVHRRLW
jgi:hypothetical protein